MKFTKKSFHMQLKLAKQFRHGKHLCATSTNSRQIPKRFQSWNHILQNHRQIIEKSPPPFAKIGRFISRTFPRIGKIRESTPFQRGMNCKAVSDLKERKYISVSHSI